MWWCWNHEAVSLFRRIDDDLFETVENSPVKLLGAIDQARLEQLLHDDGFLAHMDRVEEALNHYMNGPTWFQETYGDDGSRRCRHRLLLGRVRHPREHPDLLRRPGRAGRRPSQGGQRPGHAAGRRRPDVPRGLFPPVPQRRRLAAGTLSRERLLQPAAHPGDQARRHAAADQRAVPRPRGLGAHLAHPGRPRAALPARHQHPAEQRRGPRRSPPGSTAATATCASARRWSWASAASAPCGPWARRRPSAT